MGRINYPIYEMENHPVMFQSPPTSHIFGQTCGTNVAPKYRRCIPSGNCFKDVKKVGPPNTISW